MFTQTCSPVPGTGLIGTVIVNVDPLAMALLTEILPRCASTIRLQIGRPKPIPFAFVVKRGLQSLSSTHLVMPSPVSVKENSTLSSNFLLLIVSVPPFGIASTAFLIMLMKTLLIFSMSRLILGLSLVKLLT